MTFWSSQRLEKNLSSIIDKADSGAIDCNSITLKVGNEIYITPSLEQSAPNSHTKKILVTGEAFAIPPGQFAFLVTDERVSIPNNAMGLISVKATFKLKGLVNVSGFHVDPGWSGQLVFSVFNAGPAPVHLQQGMPLFLLWLADLDEESAKKKTPQNTSGIPPTILNNISGKLDSIYDLDKRLKEDIEKLEKKDIELSDRLHAVDKSIHQANIWLGIIGGAAITIMVFAFRPEITALLHPVKSKSDIASNIKESSITPVPPKIITSQDKPLATVDGASNVKETPNTIPPLKAIVPEDKQKPVSSLEKKNGV